MSGSISHYGNWPWEPWRLGATRARNLAKSRDPLADPITVYPKKYAHGCVALCFVVVMQSFIMNTHEVFIHIHQGCFAGTGAIVRLPQCQWSKSDGYGKISQCITTTKHSKAKTVRIFLGIYCRCNFNYLWRTSFRHYKMNAVARVQLVFQLNFTN